MGFTFNSVSTKNMGMRARLTSWQVSGQLRNYTTTVPGKYGVADFGADLDAREIRVECGILPKKNFGELVLALDDIALWLDPTDGLGELILDDVPDRYFLARIDEKVDCERLLRSAGQFSLKFFCPDPFGYAIHDEIFSIDAEGTHGIRREKGNVESNPIYRIKGVLEPSVSNYISITTNGQELKVLNATLSEGETFVVDTDRLTAYVEDEDGVIVRNGLPYLQELNFPSLFVGNNSISVSAKNGIFTSLDIQAKSRWR